MAIPRLQLFELEDQPWLPAIIRDLATDYIHFIEIRFNLHRPIVAMLADALRATGSRQVVDLCSGGAGPIPAVQRALADRGLDVRVMLTDRFPNLTAFERAQRSSGGAITFIEQPIDARAVPRGLVGFRTMFNAFHHFDPLDATAILRDAVGAGTPIGIFEIPDRRISMILPLLLTPLFVWIATPFMRPFRWRRLLWTYLLPLVPLTCLWDGLISQLRAYTADELERLTRDPALGSYVWQVGHVPIESTPGRVTYLLGRPL